MSSKGSKVYVLVRESDDPVASPPVVGVYATRKGAEEALEEVARDEGGDDEDEREEIAATMTIEEEYVQE